MIVFPEPAKVSETISSWKGQEVDRRTQAIHPQKGSSRFPLLERVALRKPCRSTRVLGFASGIEVRPWIWRRQPMSELVSDLVFQCLVTYQIVLGYNEHSYMRKLCAPSITTLARPETILRVWATAILDSSPVSRSSLWRADSISSSPRSFFTYFSVTSKS